jgi:SAM-dependent methyltransferase
MGRERLEAEFGRYSSWLVEACAELGVDPVPAVARGTGRPALLERASAPLSAAPGKTILDLGCGLGGPGAWLARHSGARVVGVDVMMESVRGLRSLFPELHAAVSSMRMLPFRNETFDAAWSLGALEMVADKAGATAEMGRVLRPGAPVVVYDFVLAGAPAEHIPQADRFSPPEDTVQCLENAGFELRDADALPQLPTTPPEWVSARDSVRTEVRRRHGTDPRFKLVEEELRTFRELVAHRVIKEWMFVARKEAA